MTPAAGFAAAAGALALGVAAALPSLAVGKREGATGAVLDFAGVTAAGGLLLVHAHLFTSGAPALWAAALFAAGLAAGRAPAKKLLALIAAALGRLRTKFGRLSPAENIRRARRVRGVPRHSPRQDGLCSAVSPRKAASR